MHLICIYGLRLWATSALRGSRDVEPLSTHLQEEHPVLTFGLYVLFLSPGFTRVILGPWFLHSRSKDGIVREMHVNSKDFSGQTEIVSF